MAFTRNKIWRVEFQSLLPTKKKKFSQSFSATHPTRPNGEETINEKQVDIIFLLPLQTYYFHHECSCSHRYEDCPPPKVRNHCAHSQVQKICQLRWELGNGNKRAAVGSLAQIQQWCIQRRVGRRELAISQGYISAFFAHDNHRARMISLRKG